MRYVVTGGMGFFGSVLMEFLKERGHEALSIDCLTDPTLSQTCEHRQVDITDRAELSRAVSEFGSVDGIFHVAAVLAHDKRQFHRLTAVNVHGTDNVMGVARDLKIPRVVFTSSNCVYAASFAEPVDETAPTNPIEEYGRTKLAGEELILSYDGQVDGVILRCPTIIAAGRMGLLTILFDFVREGRKVYVLGDGSNRYSFIYARDLADACLLSMQGRPSGIYHIGSDNVPTLRDLYGDLYRAAGKAPRLVNIPEGPAVLALKALYALGLSPLGPYHYRMLAANCVFKTDKLKNDFGWRPTKTNSEMLTEAFSYYLDHMDEMKKGVELSPHRSPAKAGILNLLRLIS